MDCFPRNCRVVTLSTTGDFFRQKPDPDYEGRIIIQPAVHFTEMQNYVTQNSFYFTLHLYSCVYQMLLSKASYIVFKVGEHGAQPNTV